MPVVRGDRIGESAAVVRLDPRRDFAERITKAHGQAVGAFLETGRVLIEAKAALPHGDFEAMVETDLPFGSRTARMLMAIARHPVLANRKHVSALPPSWGTLYELTKLPKPVLEAALTDGRITPRMERKDVVALLPARAAVEFRSKTETAADLEGLRGRQFVTVYADPPWAYSNQKTRAATHNHYPTMTVDEIAALPIADMVAENAQLHLWTTNGFLFESRRVIESWGFSYRSCFVWVKPQMGIGNYWRVSHEFLLLGVRGDATFRDKSLMSWGRLDRTKHSRKPESVRQLVQRASLPGERLELFARRSADGWTSWGNEATMT
jgi:N6-adenosine-specific RNA methylase IME4